MELTIISAIGAIIADGARGSFINTRHGQGWRIRRFGERMMRYGRVADGEIEEDYTVRYEVVPVCLGRSCAGIKSQHRKSTPLHI